MTTKQLCPLLFGKTAALDFVRQLDRRMPETFSTVTGTVSEILQDVAAKGHAAVLKYREKFEGVSLSEPLEFSRTKAGWQGLQGHNGLQGLNGIQGEVQTPAPALSEDVLKALELSIERVRRYHEIQKDETRYLKETSGDWFGSRIRPLESVALYVPGGTAFYPSSVIMSAVPAQVAGVKRISLLTPHRSLGNPVFLKTADLLGIDSIIAVGGAQAIALAAFGVPGIPRFDKVVGPGNIYVATAKKLLSGRIGIDGFAGPSEVLVLGDGTSHPDWIAADLLAQAEHDEEASAVFCTTSRTEAESVLQSLESLLSQLGDRASIARESLARWGAVLVVDSKDELAEVANGIATEHLHIQTACALTEEGQQDWSEKIHSAGAIFFGRFTSESFGDYLAGPSHVLPTAGTARFASPLGVYDFVKRSSLLHLTEPSAKRLSKPTQDFALAEGLPAHALAARLRGQE